MSEVSAEGFIWFICTLKYIEGYDVYRVWYIVQCFVNFSDYDETI